MGPRFTVNDVPHALFMQLIAASYLGLWNAVFYQAKDRANFTLAEFGVVVRLANVVRMSCLRSSLFLNAILNIVLGRTNKEMIRVTTRRVITAVANVKARRNGAIGQFIGHAMRRRELPAVWSWATDDAVSMASAATRPDPTIHWAAFLDVSPQPNLKRLTAALSTRHV